MAVWAALGPHPVTPPRARRHAPRPQEHAHRGELDDRADGDGRGGCGLLPLRHGAASHDDAVGA